MNAMRGQRLPDRSDQRKLLARNLRIMDVRNGSVLDICADSFNVPQPHVYPLSASLG